MALPAGSLGHLVHGMCLFFIGMYTLAVAAHATGHIDLAIFGTHWSSDGFCVSFKDHPRLNSHLLCLYADTAFAAVLFFIANTSTKTGVREVKENIASVFLHGVVHGSLYFLSASPPHGAGINWATAPPLVQGGAKYDALATASGLSTTTLLFLVASSQCLFWSGFLCSMTALPPRWALTQSALHAYAIVNLVPPFWFFTYVNTLLFVNIVGSKMIVAARSSNTHASASAVGLCGYEYDMYACLVSLPIMLATFAEPLLCDAFLIEWGGHVWFDTTIPVGVLVYYAVVSKSGDGEKKEK